MATELALGHGHKAVKRPRNKKAVGPKNTQRIHEYGLELASGAVCLCNLHYFRTVPKGSKGVENRPENPGRSYHFILPKVCQHEDRYYTRKGQKAEKEPQQNPPTSKGQLVCEISALRRPSTLSPS